MMAREYIFRRGGKTPDGSEDELKLNSKSDACPAPVPLTNTQKDLFYDQGAVTLPDQRELKSAFTMWREVTL